MTPEQRATAEAQTERALRRGELTVALGLLQSLAAAFPEDEALQQRLEDVRGNMLPEEAAALRPSRLATPAPVQSPRPLQPEEEGERLFALGDYAGAAAAYRRALRLRPDSPLIEERLAELVRLAQAAPRHSPTDAALPVEPEARLRALLDRIASRRRAL